MKTDQEGEYFVIGSQLLNRWYQPLEFTYLRSLDISEGSSDLDLEIELNGDQYVGNLTYHSYSRPMLFMEVSGPSRRGKRNDGFKTDKATFHVRDQGWEQASLDILVNISHSLEDKLSPILKRWRSIIGEGTLLLWGSDSTRKDTGRSSDRELETKT